MWQKITYIFRDLISVDLTPRVSSPMPDSINLIHGDSGEGRQWAQWKQHVKNTYPMSSIIAGMVRRARWSFFVVVMVVESRNLLYIFRNPSGDVGFSTVLPNTTWTWGMTLGGTAGIQGETNLPSSRKRNETIPSPQHDHKAFPDQTWSEGGVREHRLSSAGGHGGGGQNCSRVHFSWAKMMSVNLNWRGCGS